jgi:hypothetical protein
MSDLSVNTDQTQGRKWRRRSEPSSPYWHVRIPWHTLATLRAVCAERGITMSSAIRSMIDAYLAEQLQPGDTLTRIKRK